MKHKLIFFICLFLALGATRALARNYAGLDEALDSLDRALADRGAVLARRLAAIDDLRADTALSPLARNAAIAREFRSLNSDSALYYYDVALSLPRSGAQKEPSHAEMLIEYARQLCASGHYHGAMSCLDSVALPALSNIERLNYHDVRAQVLLDMHASSLSEPNKAQLRSQTVSELDSLRGLVKGYPAGENLVNSMEYALRGDTIMATGELYEAIDNLPAESPTFAIACALMADFYKNKPEKRQDYLYYLALASISDARRGNGEAFSLERLGSEILKEGDFNRALNYLSVASEAMNKVKAPSRLFDDKPPMAIMLKTMLARGRTRTTIFIITTVLLLAVILMLITILLRISHRDKRLSDKLANAQSAAEAKDLYISELFELCAVYIDAIEDMNRLVSRKIKANQIKDLYESIESGRIVKAQAERFYETFDRAVLNIYPNFVNDINSLLLPEKRIPAPEGGQLTPELRIAAFMRLGVTDSARIAKFLGLSLNTVYTYRNRMKSRAENRDNFEAQLLKIL